MPLWIARWCHWNRSNTVSPAVLTWSITLEAYLNFPFLITFTTSLFSFRFRPNFISPVGELPHAFSGAGDVVGLGVDGIAAGSNGPLGATASGANEVNVVLSMVKWKESPSGDSCNNTMCSYSRYTSLISISARFKVCKLNGRQAGCTNCPIFSPKANQGIVSTDPEGRAFSVRSCINSIKYDTSKMLTPCRHQELLQKGNCCLRREAFEVNVRKHGSATRGVSNSREDDVSLINLQLIVFFEWIIR